MEKGLIFMVFAAVAFALAGVLVRKGAAQTGESFTSTAISIFLGLALFAVALCITGEWSLLNSISERGFILFGVAGILHFVAGRALIFNGFRLIGSNKANPFVGTSIFYTVILGILFLNEPLNVLLIPGVLCIFTGAVLISTEKRSVAVEEKKGLLGTEVKGILSTLSGAVCWGLSPIVIRMGIGEVGSPYVGAFISYVAACIVEAIFFLRRQHREQLFQLPFFKALVPIVISGFLMATGQLLRYTSLSYSPASLVAPIASTGALFTVIFSFLINRQIEVFTLKVVLGMAATVVGTFLLFQ